MGLGSLLLLAVGLAMDAMAAAAARGLAAPRIRARHVARIALVFGGFQALMPLCGWWLGARLGPSVEAWDHWVAFVLLGGIGAHMLREASAGAPPPAGDGEALFAAPALCALGLATSVDAFAAGITLPLLGAPLLASILSIGAITAALTALGVFAGRRFGALLGRRLDAIGGVVLIALGARILAQHLAAG